MKLRSLWATATVICGATVAVVSGGWRSAQEKVELKVGDAAPAFSLPGSDGKTHSLADYKGKTVVLAWFPKAFTGG
jgi:thioredoxin-dependent peroxiredoxin